MVLWLKCNSLLAVLGRVGKFIPDYGFATYKHSSVGEKSHVTSQELQHAARDVPEANHGEHVADSESEETFC